MKNQRKIDLIVVHCSATRINQDFPVEALEACHKARGFHSIGYHYYITKDGKQMGSFLYLFLIAVSLYTGHLSKIIPSFFTIKEGSTFLTKPLFPQGREDVTALRCSEPLRYRVGGPSKVFAMVCGTGPQGAMDDRRNQRLRPLPNNSECEPKRTNSIVLLFLSNQIKSVSFSIWHSI